MMATLRVTNTEVGATLMETLVALFIIGSVAAAVVIGMGVVISGNIVQSERIPAEALARYELEYVTGIASDKTSPYSWKEPTWTYQLPGSNTWPPNHNSLPSGYTNPPYDITVTGSWVADNLTKVNANVRYNGNPILSVDTYIYRY